MNPKDWNRSIRAMFGSISGRYDLMNTLMSLGRDRSWRRRVVELAGIGAGSLVLDVGAGTGMIAREASRRHRDAWIVAADLTTQMMKVGKEARTDRVGWCCADAMELPFPEGAFDAVTSGFLVRNVRDVAAAFAEQFRVVRPGGTVVCLDAGPPPEGLLRPLIRVHLNLVIPLLGALVTGDRAAYRYLPDSTQSFRTAHELALLMERAGFEGVRFERRMLGTISIVSGRRPAG